MLTQNGMSRPSFVVVAVLALFFLPFHSVSGRTLAAQMSSRTGRAMVRRAFDRGVTHFDLANNYGPPYGSAEENFGQILRKDLHPYRNELIISTKAGWDTVARSLRDRRLAQIPPRLARRQPAAYGA